MNGVMEEMIRVKFLGGPAHGATMTVQRPPNNVLTAETSARYSTYRGWRIDGEWVYLHESLGEPQIYHVEHAVPGPSDQEQRSLVEARQEARIRNHASALQYRPTRFQHEWNAGGDHLTTRAYSLPDAAFTPEAPRG